MKVKNQMQTGTRNSVLRQTLLIMRLTVCLLLFAGIHVYAEGFSQTRITLKLQETGLKQALQQIEKKTQFRFLYNESIVKSAGKVTLDVTDAPLPEVMDRLLANKNINYKLLANDLVVLNFQGENMPADIQVRGKVTDAKGNPVRGASVSIKGSTVGTAADENGNFAIEAPESATIVISAIGFATQEVALNGRNSLTIVLMDANKDLDEVVVVGFGTQRKRDLTGSISSVKGEELERMPNTNPLTSMQGKVAGLTVSPSGRAGSAPIVRIRGVNSTNSADPVYVVDGVLHDNIEFLNPADIETIDVLRDPSSIAIFGLRGANGVIAITTKRAEKGTTRINFQSSIGIQRVQDKIALTDAEGFRKLYDQQLANLNAAPFDYTNYTANTNWQDLIFQDAIININNLSISNSTEKSSTLINLGYTFQDGVVKYDNHKRFMVRINQEMRLNKNIKIGGDINATHFRDNPPGVSITNALWAAPIAPVQESADVYYAMPSFQRAQVANPMANLNRNDGTAINQGFRVIGSLFGEVKFLRDFTWRSAVYTDLRFTSSRSYNALPFEVINLGEGNAPTERFLDPFARTSVSQSQSESRRFQQDHTLTYNKNLGGGHNLTALGGYTSIYSYNQFVNGSRRDTFLNVPNDPNFWYINIINANTPTFNGGGGSESSIVGGFARAQYSYMGKYLLNATIRRDGSSKFAPENRWGTFGSVGVGWVASDEAFFKNQKAIQFLKFRGAWGTTGNANGFSDFLWRPGLSNASSAVFGDNVYTAVQASYIPDSTLTWETVNGLDIGFDLKTLNNKLSFGATYYNRTTKGILTAVTIPNETRSFFTNLGEITNKGIELNLGWADNVGRDFSYSFNAIFSYNHNEVRSIGDKLDFQILGNGGVNRTISGYDIGHFFGFRQTGIYQSTADIAKTPAFPTTLPGDISYADINGDGVITQDDRDYLGTPFPPFNYGGSLSLQYKGFDMVLDGQGNAGHKIFTQRRTANFATLNYEANRLNAWNGPGTSNIEPVLDNTRGNNFLFSTYYLEPGDFFRIRLLQFGYTFGSKQLRAIGAQKARVFVSGQNIITWSKVTGYTPEPQIGSILGGGADNGAYPVPSTYTLGVNLTF
jgi:TonB-linked SusC/RagA family outer membrane protein